MTFLNSVQPQDRIQERISKNTLTKVETPCQSVISDGSLYLYTNFHVKDVKFRKILFNVFYFLGKVCRLSFISRKV